MYIFIKALASAVILSILGVSMIWKGITGNVDKSVDDKELFPGWLYVLGGVVVLIFPITWMLLKLFT